MSTDRVLLGRVTAAHGLRGEVKIASFAAQPEDIASYGPLTDADGARQFVLTDARLFKAGTIVARLKGVSDRSAAEALRGVELYVGRDVLPPPEEDEFYYSDLIGLSAVTPEGDILGRVMAVHDFGAGDLLEVGGNGGETLLIPFTKVQVPEIDIKSRRVTVIPLAPEEEDSEDRGGSNPWLTR